MNLNPKVNTKLKIPKSPQVNKRPKIVENYEDDSSSSDSDFNQKVEKSIGDEKNLKFNIKKENKKYLDESSDSDSEEEKVEDIKTSQKEPE